MRTDRQKETTVRPFLWEIQLKSLYSQGWWYKRYYSQQCDMPLYFEAAKKMSGYADAVCQRLLSCWLSKFWTPLSALNICRAQGGCTGAQWVPANVGAILLVGHQCPHCTLRQVNSESHKRQKRGTFMSALKRCWRFGSSEEGAKKLHENLVLLGVRIQGRNRRRRCKSPP